MKQHMHDTRLPTFEDTLQKTNALLKDIEAEFGWEGKREYSYKALRDRMTIEEIADLGVQLPMLVRGLYYEAWRPSATPKKNGSSRVSGGNCRSSWLDSTR